MLHKAERNDHEFLLEWLRQASGIVEDPENLNDLTR
jgi:hypothetical protein